MSTTLAAPTSAGAPSGDGQVQVYFDQGVSLTSPRIIYVNGIRTTGEVHRATCLVLSQVTQRKIVGVYNLTAGVDMPYALIDFIQCVGDWGNSFTNQVVEFGFDLANTIRDIKNKFSNRGGRSIPPSDLGTDIRSKLRQDQLFLLMHTYLSTHNKAAASLFKELHENRHVKQYIVAHSQGNLVTASALWAMQTVHGPGGLADMQVYSIASPVPAWPAGINHRIKVYAHTNDPITWFDPKNHLGRRSAGDWRAYDQPDSGAFDAHDVAVNFFGTNFVTRIRQELGLGPWHDSTKERQPYTPNNRVHVVNPGETLSLLSQKYYNTPARWQEIHHKNLAVVGPNPYVIQPGMKLIIP